jgi:hypothetical protein
MIYDGDGVKNSKKFNNKHVKQPDEQTNPPQKPVNDECFTYVNKKVETAVNDTNTWSTNQAKFNRIRMRIKKTKTFPFVGCSNLRMPTADTKIKKLKASLINVIFGIRPVVQCIPSPEGNFETAQKIEKWLDHLIMDKMTFKPKGIIGVDQTLESGFYIFKPYWKLDVGTKDLVLDLEDISMEEVMAVADGNVGVEDIVMMLAQKFEVDLTEKVAEENSIELERVALEIIQGKNKIEFTVQEVYYDAPDVALVSPQKCYVPPGTGFDPQSAEWICHEYELTLDQLKSCAKYKGWDIEGVNEVSSYVGFDTRNMKEFQLDKKEGIDRINGVNSGIKIWEWYGYYDINGDGKKEKCVITSAPDFRKTMRKIELPFDNGKWPFVKLYGELTTDRWFSHRGVVDIAEDLIKEIDVQHNMKLDSQTTRNAPMMLYRAGMVNPNLIQNIPNQAIPVRGGQPLNDTVQMLNANNPNVEYSYKDEQMILESKIEELTGQVDYSLQSMINKRQPRTLGEVELQNQSAQNVFNLDSDMFRAQFGELFGWIWDLWSQYGNDQEEFMYFGQNGWEPIRLSKEEIQGKYRFVVRGNDQNTNPQNKMAKAQQIIMAVTNPVFLQAGVITQPQMLAGLKRFFQTLDVDGWEQFINIQWQPPQSPPPPPAAVLIKPNFDELTDGEQAQVLASAGVNPDIYGRAINKQQELHDKSVEQMASHMRNGNGRQ